MPAAGSTSVTDEARRQANLRLLQRTCFPDITNIIVSATHVVLYQYLETAWHKSGIEGSLFVAERGSSSTTTAAGSSAATTLQQQHHAPKFELIILNRHSIDNFQITLDESTQLQHQEPYLIFRQASQPAVGVRGIWFHSAEERVGVCTALQHTIRLIQEEASMARRRSQSAPPHVALSAPALQPPTVAVSSRIPEQQQQQVANDVAGAALATLFAPFNLVDGTTTSVPIQQQQQQSTAPQVPSPMRATSAPAVASTATEPTAPTTTTMSAEEAAASLPGVALDKKSLQLALLSLIQDDRFLDLLHSQYLRVVRARTKKQGL